MGQLPVEFLHLQILLRGLGTAVRLQIHDRKPIMSLRMGRFGFDNRLQKRLRFRIAFFPAQRCRTSGQGPFRNHFIRSRERNDSQTE